jgi:hypothetical protein
MDFLYVTLKLEQSKDICFNQVNTNMLYLLKDKTHPRKRRFS